MTTTLSNGDRVTVALADRCQALLQMGSRCRESRAAALRVHEDIRGDVIVVCVQHCTGPKVGRFLIRYAEVAEVRN